MKKKISILIILMLITSNVSASWYVIDTKTNRAVAKAEYKPENIDLSTRDEVAIESDEDIPLEDAELFQGSIQIRTKSQAEKNEKKEKEDKDSDKVLLNNYILHKNCLEMVAAGTTFKNIKCTDFE